MDQTPSDEVTGDSADNENAIWSLGIAGTLVLPLRCGRCLTA